MGNCVTNLYSIISRYGKNPDDIHIIVGLDSTKNIFQVHAVDLDNGELITKAGKRDGSSGLAEKQHLQICPNFKKASRD